MSTDVIYSRVCVPSHTAGIAKRKGGGGMGRWGWGVAVGGVGVELRCNELSEESVIIHSDVFSAIKMSSAVNLSFKSPVPLGNFSF